MSKLLTGILIGTAIGILLAPREGSKSRKMLQSRVDELLKNPGTVSDKVEDVVDEVKTKVVDVKESVQEEVQNRVNEVRNEVADKISADEPKKIIKKSKK